MAVEPLSAVGLLSSSCPTGVYEQAPRATGTGHREVRAAAGRAGEVSLAGG